MPFRQEYSLLSDEALVELFQQGERDGAFTVIVERHMRRIYFAARKMANGDHDEADEIAQQTFVKAYEALGSFRKESKLYTWLYKIMMNSVIQRSRKQKARVTVTLEDVSNVLESDEASPETKLESAETTKLIEQAIETLPPKQRQVFLLRFYEELPYEEISTIVGTSIGGLKANYFHAIRKIGSYLHEAGKVTPEVAAKLREATAE